MPQERRPSARAFDASLIEYFCLDPEEFAAFLQTLPTYLQCEAWVREHASRLDEPSITAWNRSVCESIRSEGEAREACARLGISPIRSTTMLSALEDWQDAHAYALEYPGERTIPALSSASLGPLGARHLGRFWYKALLKALGSLAEGWHSGPEIGIDRSTFRNLDLDPVAFREFIESSLPTYVEFEAWIREHARKIDPESIARHNMDVVRDKPDNHGGPERAELGISDPTVRRNQFLNDLLDWKALHEQITALA